MALQNLRSNTANKRPTASGMVDGQVAINTNATNPGLFFKDAGDGIRKVGPVFIGSSAPNSSPAAGGSSGHSIGEQWLDTSSSRYIVKTWDGTAWRDDDSNYLQLTGGSLSGALTIESASSPTLTLQDTTNDCTLLLYSQNTNSHIGTSSNHELFFDTNGSQRMMITTGGNVGIGNTAPGAKLQIEGTSDQLKLTYTSVASYIHKVHSNGDYSISKDSNERLRIDSDGNLGVGTSSPTQRLSVNGKMHITNDIIMAQTNGRIDFDNGSSSGALRFHSTNANAERMRITSAGRVGIGDSDPDALLVIKGNSDAATTPSIRLKDGTDTREAWITNTSGDLSLNVGGNDNVAHGTFKIFESGILDFAQGAGSVLRITSSGQVVIGGTSALDSDKQLTLTTTSTSGGLGILSPNNGRGDIFFGDAADDNVGQIKYSHVDDSLTIRTNAADRFTIDSSGRLLVGATSGSYDFEVKKSGHVHGLIGSTNAAGATLLLDGDSNGDGAGSDYASISHNSDGNLVFENRKSASIIFRNTSSSTERMRIDSSGNVGIGTSSPSMKVNISHADQDGLRFNSAASGETFIDFADPDDNDIGRISYDHSDNHMAFRTNNGERMRIDSSGRLLMGSSVAGNADADNINVAGAGNVGITFRGSSSGTGNIFFADATSGDDLKRGQIVYDHSGNSMRLHTNAVERVRIDSSGRVGIGTTDPSVELSLAGSDPQLCIWEGTDGASNSKVQLGTGAVQGFVNIHKGDGTRTIQLSSDGDTYFTGGNVGIGDTAPSEKLNVAGNVMLEGSDQFLYFTNVGTGNSGIYMRGRTSTSELRSHSTGMFTWEVTGSEKMRLDSSGRFGIGTSSPGSKLQIVDTMQATANQHNQLSIIGDDSGTNGESARIFLSAINATNRGCGIAAERQSSANDHDLIFQTSPASGIPAERMRIDNLGRVLIGTTAAANANTFLTVQNSSGDAQFTLKSGPASESVINMGDTGDFNIGAIRYNQTDNAFRFFTNNTERVRINSNGDLTTTGNNTFARATAGFTARKNDSVCIGRAGGTPLELNRTNNDGPLVNFFQDGAVEGSISVSGQTVSYNGGHLSRWSQLAGGAERIEILRGSVLSNLDEMCEWGEEDNEQLNRMQVSDVEGDPNVAGVFQDWDDDDDIYTNDFYCAMTGDFVIRIAQGTTVARGDLLMSAGDGTAKPQDDDIVRSKTIAKVTSTTVSASYSDGSYCVPCVLMAC